MADTPSSNSEKVKALTTLGDWSLRVLLNEGDRFWTRIQHCLTWNSLLAAATGVVLASSSPHLTLQLKLTLVLFLSLIAAVLTWLWWRMSAKGAQWHRIYGRTFQQLNDRVISDAGLQDCPTTFPKGVFASTPPAPDVESARGVRRLAKWAIFIVAVAWSLGFVVDALLLICSLCRSDPTHSAPSFLM
jgi:hypothetical protein